MSWKYHLEYGDHTHREQGMCAMEWVAFLAGENHTDEPKCVDPILVSFFITLNDRMNENDRQLLRPYLARTIGTNGDLYGESRLLTLEDIFYERASSAELQVVRQHGMAGRAYNATVADRVACMLTRGQDGYPDDPWGNGLGVLLEKLLPMVTVNTESLVEEARPILNAGL